MATPRYEEFNGPKLFYTEQQLRARHRFEDLLTPKMLTPNETRAAIITDFTGKMEAWADERFVDQRLEKLGESGLVTREAAQEALELLRSDAFPVPRHWEMLEIVKPKGSRTIDGDDTGAMVQIMLSMVRYLAVRYETTQIHEIREIMIELLDRGLSPSDMSPWVQDVLPLVLELPKAFHTDFLMNAALIRQTKIVKPFYVDKAKNIGVSTLMHVTEEISNVVTKHFFQIGDQMRLANCTFQEAYKAMAQHPGNRGIEWRGDWFEVEYRGLYAGSETFRSVVKQWNSPSGPETFIHRSIGVEVGEDLFMSYIDLYHDFPGLDFGEEIAIQLPNHGWNIFHIAALHGWMRTPACVRMPQHPAVKLANQYCLVIEGVSDPSHAYFTFRYLHRKLQQQLESQRNDAQATQRTLDRLALSLIQQDIGTHRTPLHTAALMHGGNSTIFKALVALERSVFSACSYEPLCLVTRTITFVPTSIALLTPTSFMS